MEAQLSMIGLTTSIISNLNTPETMQRLSLNYLCVEGDHNEPYDEEKPLINSLLNNGPTQLQYLSLF